MAKTTKAKEYLKTGRLANSTLGVKGAIFDFAITTAVGVKSGRSLGTAALAGAGEALAFAMMPGPMMGYYGAMAGGAAIGAGIKAQTRLEGEYRKRVDTGPTFSYQDSQQALTMRQAAVQAIQGSKMNARNSLGGEAALMHRSKKVY